MIRRLFTFLSALSLLLCVGTCVLWVRSRHHFDEVSWRPRADRCYQIASRNGRIGYVDRGGFWANSYSDSIHQQPALFVRLILLRDAEVSVIRDRGSIDTEKTKDIVCTSVHPRGSQLRWRRGAE